jgi:hypothetical protein
MNRDDENSDAERNRSENTRSGMERFARYHPVAVTSNTNKNIRIFRKLIPVSWSHYYLIWSKAACGLAGHIPAAMPEIK